MTPVLVLPRTTTAPPALALRIAAALVLASVLGGCGALRSYRAEMDKVIEHTASGDLPGAISVLEKNNTSSDKDVLYHMELGELKRLSNDFPGSFESFQKADAVVLAWEAAIKLDPTRAVGQTGSFLVNDRVRTY
jgi:uncharacterized protein